MNLIRSEPVAIAGVISAVLALAISFGAHLSTEQVGAIMAVVSAVLAVVVRQKVSPSAS